MPEFPYNIKSKLPKVGDSIFGTMSAKAREHQAVNLSQGFPDYSPPEGLMDLVTKYMKEGQNQYAPMPGVPTLRQAIADKVEKLYGAQYDPETEITVTAGATAAIFTAISAVVSENDEVLIFEPAYDCYKPAVELSGGMPVYYEMEPPDYKVDWEKVKRRINHNTKLIVLNTPHNPTGTVFDQNDMKQLEKIVSDKDIMILSDEVYEHIIFDGAKHQSVTRFPKLAERSFVAYSFGKTYHSTGWKMGYCLAPRNMMKEFRKVHQYMVFAVNTPLQYAYADFLQYEDEYLKLSDFYQEKRDFFLEGLKDTRFNIQPAKGAYFQLLNYDGISDKEDTELAMELISSNQLASVPISVFYHKKHDHHMLRFCFAKSKETLEAGVEKLKEIGR